MSELETAGTYADKVVFNIVEKDSHASFDAECQEYDLGDHGLVILSSDGEALAKIQGHQFGKAEIESAIAEALAG